MMQQNTYSTVEPSLSPPHKKQLWTLYISITAVVLGAFGIYAYMWFAIVGKATEGIQTHLQAGNTPQTQVSVQSLAYRGFPFTAQIIANALVVKNLGENRQAVTTLTAPQIVFAFEPFRPVGLDITIEQPQLHILDRKAIGAEQARIKVTAHTASDGAAIPLPPADATGGGRLELVMENLSLGDLPALTAVPDTLVPERLTVRIEALPTLPALTFPLLTAWQKANGVLELETFSIASPNLTFDLEGFIRLDPQLQPEGSLHYRLSGFDTALSALRAEGILNANSEAFLRAALSTLWATESENGRPILKGDIMVRNRRLEIGGVFPLPLPQIAWPLTRNQPIILQGRDR